MADANRHRSHLKQQNKPFKGKSKKKDKSGRTIPLAPTPTEWAASTKESRKNASAQKRKLQREQITRKNRGLDTSKPKHPYIVGLLSMNQECDCEELKNILINNCEPGEILTIPNSEGCQVQFVIVPRDELAVLDWGKIVDCFLMVFSSRNADYSRAKLDPTSINCFDENAYTYLTALKTQGFPEAIGVMQHLELSPIKKQKDIKKLYSRFYESEFPNSSKMCSSLKPQQLLRNLNTCLKNCEEVGYRANRSYFWAHSVEVVDRIVEFTGFLKGNGVINANQLVHVTGVGDFQVNSLKTANGIFLPTEERENIEAEKDPGAFAAEQTWPTDLELSAAFSKLEVKTDHPPNDIDDEEDEGQLEISDEEKQVFEFEDRKPEDFDFPDEVNTPNDQLAKDRFQKYRGLASFRTSEWDPYENLPISYSKIYEFKEPNHIIKKHSYEIAEKSNQSCLGALVTITISNFPVHLLNQNYPVIVSTLLPHERKLTVLNFRLERWGNVTEKIKSKDQILLHYGFRRLNCKPIFTEDTTGDKSKYLKDFKDEGSVICSIFAPVCFGPCNALMYKETMEGGSLVAVGALHSFDPRKPIIKRILLTGYPLKIHKRKAVIRYMFIDPKDVRYFKPIELFTRSGLRGHITESLGTHGNMKCVFNDFIKHGDIICMPLYKRVFPKWETTNWQTPV
ncbi:hypothetical protein SteCoe_18801 [Stentor coeruleus]|uniref:Bms1-type G domain-containing protein n=1 Tax=Stentor coeruleus TaxID=5963 RepID=A0A1R2BVX7_9CILI|nr:hypothetical protein SteCoe_18801 [Stentor coeruleus]